jgi:hypothetical protein
MKKHTPPVLATLGLLAMLVAVPAYAQSSANMAVNIPFEFVVGKTVLPAGEYTIRNGTPRTGLWIESAGRGPTVFILTDTAYASEAMSESSLVFNRYGSQYFLSKVWTVGTDIGCELHKSAAEREISRGLRLAKSASKAQTVAIAAHRQ